MNFLLQPLSIRSYWKFFKLIKLLWRHFSQIQGNWAGRNVISWLTSRAKWNIGDFTNQNATQPETSPEVICSQSASLRMLGAKLQRVFFTFRTRGWHLQRFQKTWVVSTEFDLELNFLLLPYRQNCFSKSMKMLFIVKKIPNKHFNLRFTAGQLVTAMMNGQHADPPSSIPKSKTGK